MANNAMHPVGPPAGFNQKSLFGTDGIRGDARHVLTPALVLQLGYHFGKSLKNNGTVLIGQDSRNSSSMITSALTAGLTAAGCDVWSIGLCPTPAVQCLIKETGALGGFMVSASHNHPKDNGIKIFNSTGSKISSQQQYEIESYLKGDLIENQNVICAKSFGQSYEKNDLLDIYKQKLLDSVKGQTLVGVSIVLDLCWGSATACSQSVFEALGADLTLLHEYPDGNCINVQCGSTYLEPLRRKVLETKAEMGFAFDGDSDRMIAIDSKGRVIDGDHTLFLWGTQLLEKDELPNKTLVGTVMSNLGFEKAWKQKNGVLKRTPVGDQNVYKEMVNTNSVLGGEPSGHILSTVNGLFGDGLFTAIQMATLCQSKNISFTEWREESFTPFPQKLVNIPVPKIHQNKNWKEYEPLQEIVKNAEESIGEVGRVLLRPSGTEPLLRVMVEAEDPNLVNSLSTKLADLVEQHVEAA